MLFFQVHIFTLRLEGTEITVGNQLGGGGFGTVYKGTYKDKKVAIKAGSRKLELWMLDLRMLELQQ